MSHILTIDKSDWDNYISNNSTEPSGERKSSAVSAEERTGSEDDLTRAPSFAECVPVSLGNAPTLETYFGMNARELEKVKRGWRPRCTLPEHGYPIPYHCRQGAERVIRG